MQARPARESEVKERDASSSSEFCGVIVVGIKLAIGEIIAIRETQTVVAVAAAVVVAAIVIVLVIIPVRVVRMAVLMISF